MFGCRVAGRRSIDGGGRSRGRACADARAWPPLFANGQNEAAVLLKEHLVIADETQAVLEKPEPPFVIDVSGEVAPDGRAIGLRIQRSAQGPIDLCLRIQDVQYMVSLMLPLGCEANRLHGLPQPQSPPHAPIPLPLSSITIR